MQEKTITITIDDRGNTTIDLDGIAGQGCERVFDNFRGGDKVKLERKKPAYYAGREIEQEKSRR
jgi:hypothetical protein